MPSTQRLGFTLSRALGYRGATLQACMPENSFSLLRGKESPDNDNCPSCEYSITSMNQISSGILENETGRGGGGLSWALYALRLLLKIACLSRIVQGSRDKTLIVYIPETLRSGLFTHHVTGKTKKAELSHYVYLTQIDIDSAVINHRTTCWLKQTPLG